jgi:hypothetical protein
MDSFMWVKSSRSGGSGDNCVEVALNVPGTVAVRDSKEPDGHTLTFTPKDWHQFTSQLNNEQLHPA